MQRTEQSLEPASPTVVPRSPLRSHAARLGLPVPVCHQPATAQRVVAAAAGVEAAVPVRAWAWTPEPVPGDPAATGERFWVDAVLPQDGFHSARIGQAVSITLSGVAGQGTEPVLGRVVESAARAEACAAGPGPVRRICVDTAGAIFSGRRARIGMLTGVPVRLALHPMAVAPELQAQGEGGACLL